MYQVQQFAQLAGVTVRALHHYDRMGLVKPRRTEAGYRLYSDRDLERLEQVVALKFIGIPLKEIRALLDRDGSTLPGALGNQRRALEAKRLLVDRAIGAIQEAEAAFRSGRRDTALLKRIIEVIEMQNDMDWAKKYYSEAAQAKIESRRAEWSPELQERVSKQWLDLIADVEAAMKAGENPAGAQAQALAARWKELVAGFTGGDPEVTKGLGKLWADKANWPAHMKQQAEPFKITPGMWEFISKAMAAKK
ncbi:MAG TPA: MerR family transcriptional regulator [Bryobacteraceae bacterium]|nr:MerR family transcriptional regulator [Bryobacteraceae bacterium]